MDFWRFGYSARSVAMACGVRVRFSSTIYMLYIRVWHGAFKSRQSRNQGVEMGVASFTITPNDLLAKFLLSISANWGSANTVILVPKKNLHLRLTKIPLNWKLKLPPCLLGLLIPLNQYVRKEVTELPGVTHPDYRGETGLLLYNGG